VGNLERTRRYYQVFKNQYGDPLEALNLHLTSNVPVSFKVFVDWTHGPGGF